MCAIELTALDRYSLTWLTASWMGHTLFSGFRSGKRHRLQDALHSHFKNWLEVLYKRDIRSADVWGSPPRAAFPMRASSGRFVRSSRNPSCSLNCLTPYRA